MAAGEPSAETLSKFATLSGVALWMQMPLELSQQYFKTIGATGQEHPRVLGMMGTDEVMAEISDMTIADKPLTFIQKGNVRYLAHTCRLVAGTEKTQTAVDTEARLVEAEKEIEKLTAQPSGPTSSPFTSSPQVQLKHVVSQGNEEIVPKISQQELTNHWDTFKAIYGRDPRPEEECTAEQLTGIDVLLKRDTAPYVDFGIWGPNHHRLLKKLRNTGLQLHVGGILRQVEIAGPPDIHAWSECYHLLTTALVGFGAVGLGPLLDYGRLISGYANRSGPDP